MRKVFMALMIIIIFNICLKAQDFHFIYISLDNSMSLVDASNKISNLMDRIGSENEDFVIFFTNSFPKRISSDINDVNGIINLILNTATTTAIDMSDELNLFIEIFEKNEVSKIIKDTIDNKFVVRPIEKYKAIVFDIFVGDEFFELGSQNSLLAKFLFASDLHLKDFNVDINYYNTSNLTKNKIMFNEIFRTNNIKTHIR